MSVGRPELAPAGRSSQGPPPIDALPAARRADASLAIGALVVCGALYAAQLAMFPTTDDQDAALHALYARFPHDLARVLGAFARPLFTAIYALPGIAGYPAMRVFTLLVCLAAAATTYAVARKLALPAAWLAIPALLLQPALYQLGTETMTEPLFALVLAAGLLALVFERPRTAALIWSFLPLVRPEGPIVLAVVAGIWIPSALAGRRSWQPVLLLGVGAALWAAASLIATGDVLFVMKTFPWPSNATAVRGSLLHYVARWPYIIGVGVLPFWIAGIVVSWRRRRLRLVLLFTVAVVSVHAYLWAEGRLASWGFDRYFVTVAPCTALLGAAGAGALSGRHPAIAAALAGPLLVVQAVQAFLYVDTNPLNYAGAATLMAWQQAQEQLDGRDYHVVSADHFGYVFADGRADTTGIPVADPGHAAEFLASRPSGTVVLWDDLTGWSWYYLSVDDIVARGYRVLWRQQIRVGSPRMARYDVWRLYTHPQLYQWMGWNVPWRDIWEAVLVRE